MSGNMSGMVSGRFWEKINFGKKVAKNDRELIWRVFSFDQIVLGWLFFNFGKLFFVDGFSVKISVIFFGQLLVKCLVKFLVNFLGKTLGQLLGQLFGQLFLELLVNI